MSAPLSSSTDAGLLGPYLPRLLGAWLRESPADRYQVLDATMVSADISGFTKLSEQLASLGKQGAEQLTDLLNECFDGMIDICGATGGDVLKFGGDALLVLFDGTDHAERACRASVGMRESIARPVVARSGRTVKLRISIGINSGQFVLYLVDVGHRELIVTGPEATGTVVCEAAAAAGQILAGHGTVGALDRAWLGSKRPDGRLIRVPAALVPASVGDGGATLGSAPAGPAGLDGHPLPLDLATLVSGAHREQIEVGVHGEHRRVTTAFVKFSGTDQLLEDHGPDEVADRLQTLGSTVRDAVDRHGVHWLASDIYPDGGKIILTAGAPSSFGDDEERMLRALRAILDADQPICLHAGANRGHVFVGDLGSSSRRTYTVMGDAVNLAARLMQKAGPGELIATRHLLAHARSRFELGPIAPFMVKGKSAPIEAASVGSVGASAHAVAASESTLPFFGRQGELAGLQRDLENARQRGRGIFVDVVGEPGIGKTRLLQELRRHAAGMEQVTTYCQPYLSTSPYGAAAILLRTVAGMGVDGRQPAEGPILRDWVTKVAPDLLPWLPLIAIPFAIGVTATPQTESIDVKFRRDRMHSLVADLLGRALPVPTFVRIEDGHFLDDASRELLLDVLNRLAAAPWVVAMTRVPGVPPFVARLAGRTIHLGPLDADARRALAAAALEEAGGTPDPETVDMVAERADGNPLFTVELAAAAHASGSTDTLPDSIEAAVTSRIDSLPASDRLRLREASVLGVRFDPDLFTAAMGQHAAAPASWENLHSVVTVEPGGLVHFRHQLTHRVVYEALSYRRRRAVHQLVGEALERRADVGGAEVDELLSLHFSRAEHHAKAWRYSVGAGRRAQATYANVEAAEFYSRALASARYLDDVPPAEKTSVAESLGDVRELAGSYAAASAAYSDARRVASAAMQPGLLRKEGVIRERTGRYADALRWYGRGLRMHGQLVRDGQDPGRAAGIELSLAYSGVRFRQGRYRECARWARLAATDAELAGDRRSLAHALYLLALSSNLLGERDVADYGAQALHIFDELGDHVGQANVLNNRAISAYYEGRWTEALRLYRLSRQHRERAGDVVGAATALNNIGEILSDQGRLPEAVAMFEAARRDFDRYRYALGVAVTTSNLGRAEGRAGRTGQALTLLDVAGRQLRDIGAMAFVLETDARRAECLVLEGRHAEAMRLTDELLERLARSGGDDVVRVQVMRTRSRAVRQGGDARGSYRILQEAVALAESVDAGYELALCLDALGGWGDVAPVAEDARRRATELFAQMGIDSRFAPPIAVPVR